MGYVRLQYYTAEDRPDGGIDRYTAIGHLLRGQTVFVYSDQIENCTTIPVAKYDEEGQFEKYRGRFLVGCTVPAPDYPDHLKALTAAENLLQGNLDVTEMRRGMYDRGPNRKARRDKLFGRKPNQPSG